MELCKIQVISERQCLETAMPNKFYKLYSQLIQAGTNRMKMCFGSVPFDRKKERDREREGGMEEERDTHTHTKHQQTILTIIIMPDIIIIIIIPCSTKIFRQFFKIKSVCRNVETKGKVFWK